MKLIALVLCSFALCWAADNPVVGKWDAISNDGSGEELKWTLTVNETEGKLSGMLSGGPGDVPLVDPKLEGNAFTFKISINSNCLAEFKLKVEGKKLEGTFSCPEVSGTFKGTKKG